MPGLRDILDAATPGGWRVQGWDDEERCWFVLGGGPEFSAAEHGVAAALVQPTETVDSPRAIANARLIALAPELAALVLEMGDWLRNWTELNPPPQGIRARELLARLDQLGKEQT